MNLGSSPVRTIRIFAIHTGIFPAPIAADTVSVIVAWVYEARKKIWSVGRSMSMQGVRKLIWLKEMTLTGIA